MGKGAIVSGRVQGVGFRYFVKTEADLHSIVGEVWNRDDGCVQLIAHHPDAGVLDEFFQRLKKGPGRVQSIDIFDAPEFSGLVEFSIGPTRS